MTEILQTKLQAHIEASDSKFLEVNSWKKEVNDLFKAMDIKINNKVSYREFTWVLGVMIMILMAMFGWIAYQIGQINLNSANTDKSVSMIQGKLDPYNVEFKP